MYSYFLALFNAHLLGRGQGGTSVKGGITNFIMRGMGGGAFHFSASLMEKRPLNAPLGAKYTSARLSERGKIKFYCTLFSLKTERGQFFGKLFL